MHQTTANTHAMDELPGSAQSPVIQISNLQFTWKRRTPNVLDIPLLELAKGERVFLQGSSGSGKSTLLSLLAAVATLRDGEIRVLGQDLLVLNAARRDRFRVDHIGIIFQELK